MTRSCFFPDLVLEMPASCFHHKDFLNHRYRLKRVLYLLELHRNLQGNKMVHDVKFSCFRHDIQKPILLVKPQGLTGLSSKFMIRIFPCPPSDLFPLDRFRPSRNNVRVPGIDDIAQQPPTPVYNSCVAEDLRFTHHLELLHSAFGGLQAFADAVMLLKVWARQRGFEDAPDSFNGFLLSMVNPDSLPHPCTEDSCQVLLMLLSFQGTG